MTEDQNASGSYTTEFSSQPSPGIRPIRVYDPPPHLDDDLNPDDVSSSVSDPQEGAKLALPFVQFSFPALEPRTNFRTLQAWEGVVTDVQDSTFSVRLVDLTSNEPDEESNIDFEDVSKDERPLVRTGAVFLLHVGYSTSQGGQRSRTALLRFRRLPVWTEPELSSAEKAAEEQVDQINWQ